MTLPRGPRPLTNDQVIASHGLPDKRETTKSPVNLIDFDTIIKLGRLGLLEQGNRSLHKDSGADALPAPGVATRSSGTRLSRTTGEPPRRADYTPLTLPIRPPSTIPMLRPEFFQSDFWHHFHAQRPLLEPEVFLSRLKESLDGTTDSLGVPGRLVAMGLVVWAASFGHDEEGKSNQSSDPEDWKLSVKSRTNTMVKELLYLIDSYGIIRKPTWDGLVALLTILPLTKEVIPDSERTALHNSAMNAAESLVHDFEDTISHEERLKQDIRPLARAFWWCVIQDWTVHSPSGGRMVLTTDDLHRLESLLPPPAPPAGASPAIRDYVQNLTTLRQNFNAPLKLASAYRVVQGILSSQEFRTRGTIDEAQLKAAWLTLDTAWDDLKTSTPTSFEPPHEYKKTPTHAAYRRNPTTFEPSHDAKRTPTLATCKGTPAPATYQPTPTNATNKNTPTPAAFKSPQAEFSRHSRLWKLFIFECRNHLDISLNQVMASQSDGSAQVSRICDSAHSKCRILLKPIMEEIRALSETSLGQYDACGISKPIYSVAALIARSPTLGTTADFLVCLKVLQQTRWVYSDHEKKVADLRFLWNVSRDESLDGAQISRHFQFLDELYDAYSSSNHANPTRSRGSSPARSARSRVSSEGSFCILEGHNSPNEDVPSRKSPRRLADVLSKWEEHSSR